MDLKSIIRLTRAEHGIMLSFAVLISVFFTTKIVLDVYLLGLLLIPFLISAGAFALNDYFDIKTDKLNKKDRPIVKGEISPEFAVMLSAAMFFIAVIISFFYNVWVIHITGLFTVVSVIYNCKLKDYPLLGNMYIALTMAIPFVYGNIAYSLTFASENIVLFAMALAVGMSRELIKTAEDFEGDKKARFSRTLPYYVGIDNTLRLAGLILIIFVGIVVYSFTVINFSYVSGALIIVCLLYYLYLLFRLLFRQEQARDFYCSARNYTLLAMALGLVSFFLARFGL